MLHRRELVLGSIGAGIAALGAYSTAQATESIRDLLRQIVGAGTKVAGMVAVIVEEDGTHMTSFGSSGVPGLALNGDTVFEIGSITKVVTTLMLADMAQRGEVAFDDPVAKYLPPSVTLHERGRPITLLDLATYTPGLPRLPSNVPPNWWTLSNPFSDYTDEKLYEFLSSYVPEYEPGTHYTYANPGFALLGIALARRSGKSYEELLIERVCDPLGLSHTAITLSSDMKKHLAQGHDVMLKPTPLWDFRALQAAGAARASVKDLIVLLKACIGLSQSPLAPALAQLLKTRRPTGVAGTDVGLGWFISSNEREEIVWKSGLTGGFNTVIAFSTRRRRGALVLSNFIWEPMDLGTIDLGMKLINPDFHPDGILQLMQT